MTAQTSVGLEASLPVLELAFNCQEAGSIERQEI